MASVRKYRDGYRAHICVKGVRGSATFRTKREAEAWAFKRTQEIEQDQTNKPIGEKTTLGEVLNRYGKEVSPTKRGKRWELIRVAAFQNDENFPSKTPIAQVTAEDLGFWRDQRLKTVGASTVVREFTLLSHVFETARREWKMIEKNPVSDVRRPRQPDHRERIISPSEIRQMLSVLGYPFKHCGSVKQASAATFLMGLRTGMRAGEICKLKWSDVKDDHYTITGTEIGAGKTGRRVMPMVYQVRRLFDLMKGWDDVYVFAVQRTSLDEIFRRHRDRIGLSGFTFHDSRHTAATRISKQVDVLTLCKLFGWKSTTQALTYYNPTPEQMRKQMEGKRTKSRAS